MTAEPMAAVRADQDDIDNRAICTKCRRPFTLDEVMVAVPYPDAEGGIATCEGCAPVGQRAIHRYAATT